jgi:hypothetical protein
MILPPQSVLDSIFQRLQELEDESTKLRLRCEDLEDEIDELERINNYQLYCQDSPESTNSEQRDATCNKKIDAVVKRLDVLEVRMEACESSSTKMKPDGSDDEQSTHQDVVRPPSRSREKNRSGCISRQSSTNTQHLSYSQIFNQAHAQATTVFDHRSLTSCPIDNVRNTPTKAEIGNISCLCKEHKWKEVLQAIEKAHYLAGASWSMQNSLSTTLIHQVIVDRGDPEARASVSSFLLTKTPHCARVRSGQGSLPLHVICQRNVKMPAAKKTELILQMIFA